MDGLLAGRVAAITGASARIGRAACLTFAREGARIVVADLDAARAEAIAAQVRDGGGEAVACGYDPAAAGSGEALVAAARTAFGRLDILLNNAGLAIRPKASNPPSGRRARQKSDTAVARFYTVNVDGVENASRAALRQFETQGGGGVIVTVDLIARLTDYGSVRHDPHGSAVGLLTRTLALEAAEQGTRVNAFSPAGMPSGSDADGEEDAEDRTALNPLGRAVTAEACADAALFLASELARTISGVNLPVDGGLAAAAAQRSDTSSR